MDPSSWFIVLAIVFGVAGQYIGYKQGLIQGMSRMYDTLYKSGKRKGDSIIVELEYESRFEKREW
jgi:hypothetical protein